MVHLVKKKKKGKVYLYLQETGRINGKSKRLWQIYLGPEHKFKERTQIITIPDVETRTIEFGLIAALYLTAEKLEVVKIINKVVNKRNQGLSVGEHVLFAAINRCVDPISKTHLKDWFDSTILKKIYPNIKSALDSRSYWTHFRYLTEEVIEKLGEELALSAIKNFNVSFNDLLFDPTNFFTYINPNRSNQTLPRHGHSKEGRATLNLINFSLFCALDGGVPFLHLIYPGNVHDSTHFKEALNKLKKRLNKINVPSAEITLTFDKGNLSQEAFMFIDREGFDYIASIRPSTQKDLLSLSPEIFDMDTLPNGKKIGVKEFFREIYGKKRRLIAIYNPNQAHWSQENFEIKVNDKINAIYEFFKDRLNTKRWSKEPKIREKCENLLGSKKFRKVINIDIKGKEGNLILSLSKNDSAFKEHLLTLGKSFLMTSRTDLEPLDIVWAYRQQYIIEHAFKFLKNPRYLSIRPMFHRVDSSIRGHVFTCFLGLLLLSLLVRGLVKKDIPMSIPKTIKMLNKIKITEIIIPGREKPIMKVDKMSKDVKLIYDALDLKRFV
ncbi:MAG: IS1634 family transposase [Promethearchaeota archaeon]